MSQVNEFVISVDKGQLIRQSFAPQIEKLFNVRLEFTSDLETAKRTGNEWIKISGNENDRKKAEVYTKGISNPETRVFFLVPEFLQTHNSWNRDELIWHVQRESGALVQNENLGKIYLQGSEIAVAMAISLLEDRVNFLGHHQTFLPYQQNERFYHQPGIAQANIYGSSYNSDIVAKGSVGLNSHHQRGQEAYLGRGAASTNYAHLKDFATKLGYSTEEINTAISKCTTVINENSLLQQLVTLFPRKFPYEMPVSSTSSKLTRDSCQSSELKNSLQTDVKKTSLATDAKGQKSNTATDNKLRHIVVDGSNVAMSHGNREVFSCKGIMICVDYFKKRGHKEITVFVPQWRKEASKPDRPIVDQHILLELEKERILAFTPSRRVNGRRVVCYDDRYIVRFASENDGIIVSNDNFRDLEKENPEWKRVIEQRLLMYTFVKDCFMPPDDPLGRHGPKLDEFLKKGTVVQPRLCPYRKKCTYGQKCKFYHPERVEKNTMMSNPKTMQNTEESVLLLKSGANESLVSGINFSSAQQNQIASGHMQKNQQETFRNMRNTDQSVSASLQKSNLLGQEKSHDNMQKDAQSIPARSNAAMQALQSMFPNNTETVRKVMHENPQETDANKLAELILRALDTDGSFS